MILWACDRWEAYKGPIKTLFECEDTREVNGENALSITTLARLDKGDRLVWRDLKGRWHENIVDGVEEERASAGILYTYYCPTSAQIELLGDYLEDKRPYDVSAYAALASALSSSRWQVGTVADLGQAGTNFYHTNAWAAIHDVADTWGGELSFEIQVSGTKVTARRVCMAKQVGEDNGKRFTYAKDLVSVKRSVDEGNVCTALYGYGKSLQTADEDGNLTGGYDRKLTFGGVNGGQNWVGSADALARWGRPDGKGGKAHVFGDVEFSDCEDAAELKKLTEAQLAKSCVPTVSYTVDAVALARAGEGFEGADEGDLVTVVDKVYDPPLRVRTRITKVVEDQLRPGEVTYTFGNYQTVAELMAAQKSAAKSTASTIRATVTEAVNASNKASTGKWGEPGGRRGAPEGVHQGGRRRRPGLHRPDKGRAGQGPQGVRRQRGHHAGEGAEEVLRRRQPDPGRGAAPVHRHVDRAKRERAQADRRGQQGVPGRRHGQVGQTADERRGRGGWAAETARPAADGYPQEDR